MRTNIRCLIAIGLMLGSAALPVLANDARGLDFGQYLLLRRDMTEGQVVGIAGQPDLYANQGVAQSNDRSERTELAVRTYTYLPTGADPETTTVTFVGGRVVHIRRDKMF